MGLFKRLLGSGQPLACSRCEKPVRKRGGARPMWYDSDRVDYRCKKCKALFCGVCATSYPDRLQDQKAKYGASGPALKVAIDADEQALFMKGDLDPVCPKCEYDLVNHGEVL